MKSVPVEKCDWELANTARERIKLEAFYKDPDTAQNCLDLTKTREIILESIQAAKEERDVELLEKIIEMKDKQYEDRQILSVIQGELSIGSIINKHQ